MTPRLNIAIGIILLAIGIPFYWYFIEAGTQGARAQPLSITQLRALAQSKTGPMPQHLRYETVGHFHVSLDRLAAGTGLWSAPVAIRAYQITMADDSSVTIDAGITQATAQAYGVTDFSSSTQHRIDLALKEAKLNLFLDSLPLHGHPRDTGSRSTNLHRAASPGARGTTKPYVITAGIVAIPTPGLQPGSTLYYVRTRAGREFLFCGDVAMLRDSWRKIRPPARFVTSFRRPQDRKILASWLLTIRALHQQAPGMAIIEGHDPRELTEMTRGFDVDEDLALASGQSGNIAVMARLRGKSRTPDKGRNHAL